MTKKQVAVLIAMAMGIFLCMLDTTIMNIALPAIQTGLHTNLDDLQWALNVYTIIFASLTIPLGRLGDQFGKHKVYILGLILFGVGSLTSTVSNSIGILIIGRGVQSLGAAVVFPASMTIGMNTVGLQKRNTAVLILGITQGLAAALGPTIGGIVTEYLGWRGIFLINLPIILVVMIMCVSLLPLKNEAQIKSDLDGFGTLLSVITLFSLTLALVKGNDWNWNSLRIIGLLIGFVVALTLFIWQEHRIANPMIRLDLFKYRHFTGAVLVTVLAGIFFVGLIVLMPSLFTKVQGYSELQAALMITPASLMVFIFSPISGLLLEKIGSRLLVGLGFMLMGGGYVVLTVMNPAVHWQFEIACILIGAGYGVVIGPITVLSAGDFTGELLTASQSVIGVFRQIGTVLAVAIFVSALTANLDNAKHDIWITSQKRISDLKIDKAEKAKVRKDTHHNLFDTENMSTQVKPAVNKRQENQIVNNQAQQYLTENHIKNAPTNLKMMIRRHVAKKVDVKIDNLNHEVGSYLTKTKHLVKAKITKAFMAPYRVAMPFVWLFLGVVFVFKKKRA